MRLEEEAAERERERLEEELRLSLLPKQEVDNDGNPVYRDEHGNIDPLWRPLTDRSTDEDAPPPPTWAPPPLIDMSKPEAVPDYLKARPEDEEEVAGEGGEGGEAGAGTEGGDGLGGEADGQKEEGRPTLPTFPFAATAKGGSGQTYKLRAKSALDSKEVS